MDQPLFTGRLPNAFYNAVSWEQLRSVPSFYALPPTDSIMLHGTQSYRYVRQDDPLWDMLHTGLLSTGCLPAALGFYEPSGVKALKLGQGRASHALLLGVCNHLMHPLYTPDITTHNEEGSLEEVERHNAAMTWDFNFQPPCPNQGVCVEESMSSPDRPPQRLSGNVDDPLHKYDLLAPEFPKNKGRTRHNNRKGTAPSDGIPEELKLKKAHAAESIGLQALRCAWGKTQEAATLYAVSMLFPESRVCEVGLCALDDATREILKSWGYAPGSLPPLGASPDCLIRHSSLHINKQGKGIKKGTLTTTTNDSESENKRESNLSCIDGNSDGRADPLCESREDLLEEATEEVEVVEVKNTCPFDYCQAQSARGRGRKQRKFVICDRGPRTKVDAMWVPQLQLQMLCAGTSSGLLVSRSATKGIRVFRMRRDDEYVRLMLSVLSVLWQYHVVPHRMPSRDGLAALPHHQLLLKRTREIAGAAVVVKEVGPGQMAPLPGRDTRFFLD